MDSWLICRMVENNPLAATRCRLEDVAPYPAGGIKLRLPLKRGIGSGTPAVICRSACGTGNSVVSTVTKASKHQAAFVQIGDPGSCPTGDAWRISGAVQRIARPRGKDHSANRDYEDASWRS